MVEEKIKINWIEVIIILLIFLVIAFTCVGTYNYYVDKIKYCESKGYEWYSSSMYSNDYPNDCARCGRDVLSPSGVGTENEYSGCLD